MSTYARHYTLTPINSAEASCRPTIKAHGRTHTVWYHDYLAVHHDRLSITNQPLIATEFKQALNFGTDNYSSAISRSLQYIHTLRIPALIFVKVDIVRTHVESLKDRSTP
jgi:hypothetical protein